MAEGHAGEGDDNGALVLAEELGEEGVDEGEIETVRTVGVERRGTRRRRRRRSEGEGCSADEEAVDECEEGVGEVGTAVGVEEALECRIDADGDEGGEEGRICAYLEEGVKGGG